MKKEEVRDIIDNLSEIQRQECMTLIEEMKILFNGMKTQSKILAMSYLVLELADYHEGKNSENKKS